MLKTGSLDERLIHRTFENDKFHGSTQYMIESEPAQTGAAPQAFLATQTAQWVLPTHYHRQDQFQVIVAGTGTLGRHALHPLSVHFASRESGYGPIVAGVQGLQYLTLRAVTDPGAWYLPESRQRMIKGLPKVQRHGGPLHVSTEQELSARGASQIETVLAPDASGLAGWLVRLGPGSSLPEPTHEGGGGRFLVVVAGHLTLDGKSLRARAHGCAFASQDEPPLHLTAGSEGAEILVLQCPRSALDPLPA